uniref:Uncharacterized protein n=1 Tax=Glossina pallidipes TaxID=7398 RepID=A0A1B0ABE1_GLOPL
MEILLLDVVAIVVPDIARLPDGPGERFDDAATRRLRESGPVFRPDVLGTDPFGDKSIVGLDCTYIAKPHSCFSSRGMEGVLGLGRVVGVRILGVSALSGVGGARGLKGVRGGAGVYLMGDSALAAVGGVRVLGVSPLKGVGGARGDTASYLKGASQISIVSFLSLTVPDIFNS